MSAAQQAGILCADPVFQRFLTETQANPYEDEPFSEEAAVEFVKRWCGVQSRRHIEGNTPAIKSLERLVTHYRDWQRFSELVP